MAYRLTVPEWEVEISYLPPYNRARTWTEADGEPVNSMNFCPRAEAKQLLFTRCLHCRGCHCNTGGSRGCVRYASAGEAGF